MPNFSILLPSSDKQVSGGNPLAPDMFDYRTSNTFNYFHVLHQDRRALIDALGVALDHDGFDAGAVLGEKGDALVDLIKTNRSIYSAPLMSALQRYHPGVLYQSIDFSSLPTGAQRRLLEDGIIISGVFGLLRPDDMIPEYRLAMDADLPELGRVSDFWRETLSANLNEALSGKFVWNLLPESYESSWNDDQSYEAMVRIVFAKRKGDDIVPITTDVLPLYGKIVCFIVEETLEDLELFWEWKHPSGYKPDESLSSYDEETKTHTIMMIKRR